MSETVYKQDSEAMAISLCVAGLEGVVNDPLVCGRVLKYVAIRYLPVLQKERAALDEEIELVRAKVRERYSKRKNEASLEGRD